MLIQIAKTRMLFAIQKIQQLVHLTRPKTTLFFPCSFQKKNTWRRSSASVRVLHLVLTRGSALRVNSCSNSHLLVMHTNKFVWHRFQNVRCGLNLLSIVKRFNSFHSKPFWITELSCTQNKNEMSKHKCFFFSLSGWFICEVLLIYMFVLWLNYLVPFFRMLNVVFHISNFMVIQ